MRKSSETFSIFSQIDQVVSEIMVREGKLTMIPQDLIPVEALYRKEDGRRAVFAVVIPHRYRPEYERRAPRTDRTGQTPVR